MYLILASLLIFLFTSAVCFKGNDLLVTNEWGTTFVPFRERRLTHPNGWMTMLPVRSNFWYEFDYGSQFTNVSYTSMFYFLGPEDYVSKSCIRPLIF